VAGTIHFDPPDGDINLQRRLSNDVLCVAILPATYHDDLARRGDLSQ